MPLRPLTACPPLSRPPSPQDFTAQIQTLDIPGEVKAGYSPIGFVRCGRSACKITKINWKASGGGGGRGGGAPLGGRGA